MFKIVFQHDISNIMKCSFGGLVMDLIKPQKLNKGDTIATLSPSLGLAGDSDVLWRYELGKKCLEDLYRLHVVAAPNSMKG